MAVASAAVLTVLTVFSTVPAFVMTLPNRTVTITMVVNQRATSGSDERIESAVTGRNTEYNQPSTVSRECTTLPSYS